MSTTQTNTKPEDNNTSTFALTPKETKTLRAFHRHHKRRHLTRLLLLLGLIYCTLVGLASCYYAGKMFLSGAQMPDSARTIEKYFQAVEPYLAKLDFFNVGLGNLLHAVLLFYLANRAWFRLHHRRFKNRRARLVLKLESRLQELGELPVREEDEYDEYDGEDDDDDEY